MAGDRDWFDALYDENSGDTFSSSSRRSVAVDDTTQSGVGPARVPGQPVPVEDWGRGRPPDPFLQSLTRWEDDSHVSTTPEEDAELRRREGLLNEEDTPEYDRPELQGADSGHDHPGEIPEVPSGNWGADDVRTEDGSHRTVGTPAEPEDDGATATDRTTDWVAPIRRSVRGAREALHPANIRTRRWSFLWAVAASWLVGPQFLVALWDRLVYLLGFPYLMSGEKPMEWGILYGPGRWFRDQVALAWQNDTLSHLGVCAAFGIAPLILMSAAVAWKKWARLLLAVAVLGPVVYLLGVSYAGWPLTWQDIYLVAIFSSAWYCTIAARERAARMEAERNENVPTTLEEGEGAPEGDFVRFILMIPLASIISGFSVASPGAAF